MNEDKVKQGSFIEHLTELRSRLPNSISDQVVQMLANSKQALLDFAEIRTQQDVDQFNQQYDVTLTLPQEG